MMYKKRMLLILILVVFHVLAVNALSISMIDEWGSDSSVGSSTSDSIAFVDDEVLPKLIDITNKEADMVCYDWDSNGRWDNCYWDNSTGGGCGGGGCNANSCNSSFSIPGGMSSTWKAGCKLESDCRIGIDGLPSRICATCDGVDTSTKKRYDARAEVYYDCDNSAGKRGRSGYIYQTFYIVDRKKLDCSGLTYHYYSQGRYSSSLPWKDIKFNQCPNPYYTVCDENDNHDNHDDVESSSRTASLLNPCSIADGTEDYNACTADKQCFSGKCGSTGTEYTSKCSSDGSDSFSLTVTTKKTNVKSCGGRGVIGGTDTESKSCSSDLDANYICDRDLEKVRDDSFTSLDICKLNKYATCTSNSQCWNDNGGYDCMGSIGTKICTNGNNGETCTSNDNSQCDSGRCDSTCQAKISDGLTCDEASDCSTGTCTSGKCGGAAAQKCSGTLNVLSQDNDGSSVASTYVYLNSNSQGQSDSNGYKSLSLSNYNCGELQSIQVKCSDASTVCQTKQAAIDIEGETESLSFNCQICLNKKDVLLNAEDVSLADISSSSVNVSALVRTENLAPSNLEVSFTGFDKDNRKIDSRTVTASLSSYSSKLVSVPLNGNNLFSFKVVVDPNSKSGDENRNNNEVYKYKGKVPKVCFDINTNLRKIDDIITNYLKKNGVLNNVEILSSCSGQDVTLKVGKPSPTSSINDFTYGLKKKFQVNKKDRYLDYEGKKGIYPYNGVVAGFKQGSTNYILIYGTEIDGTIAAVKRFVENQGKYFAKIGTENSEYINNLDVKAISISDYMHANETQQKYYSQDNNNFMLIVNNSLHNTFQEDLKNVKTNDNTVLRLKQVKATKSNKFLDATARAKPVIYSGGLWNNLFKWQEFSNEMANTGREGWMIEVTGGPNEECDTCKDYTYDDLVDDYWPASVAAALAYSETNGVLNANPSLDKADYVGFSNGCRVALDSLSEHGAGYSNNWKREDIDGDLVLDTSLPSSPIDTFVGVGCPGAFEGDSVFKSGFKLAGSLTINNLRTKNINHATRNQFVAIALPIVGDYLFGLLDNGNKDNKISVNLFSQYNDWATKTNDSQPGSGVSFNKFAILEGSFRGKATNNSNDDVVTTNDAQAIYNNINSNNKVYLSNFYSHNFMVESRTNMVLIKKILNNESLTKDEINLYVKQKTN